MDKEKELINTNNIVKNILESCADARDCDTLMIALVVKRINPDVLKMSFQDVLMRYNDLGLPKFETIRRARQKNQAENPSLGASEKVKSYRNVNEEIFREYVKS